MPTTRHLEVYCYSIANATTGAKIFHASSACMILKLARFIRRMERQRPKVRAPKVPSYCRCRASWGPPAPGSARARLCKTRQALWQISTRKAPPPTNSPNRVPIFNVYIQALSSYPEPESILSTIERPLRNTKYFFLELPRPKESETQVVTAYTQDPSLKISS